MTGWISPVWSEPLSLWSDWGDAQHSLISLPCAKTDQPGHPPSDQSSLHNAKDTSFLHADSEDSDQNGWMPRLICLRWAHKPLCWFCHQAAHSLFVCYVPHEGVTKFQVPSPLHVMFDCPCKLYPDKQENVAMFVCPSVDIVTSPLIGTARGSHEATKI